ncbi:MAG TPA: protein kinase [Candidatus Krumholzibacteria bacterium]|nr:protein kinase [Candidatus Krumholzibacteria bacterium]
MSLANGTRLGPYEILGTLGAGGMGEVYRARDTRLDRMVAIKVLPAHLVSQPEVRQRFEREARAVSSLNHPNICVLHDVGADFFVMEYLEGESLASRIEKGPLPTAELLQVGIQVADALSAAHRAGLIHRDLKPGNVMLTKSGAKLLDFGLARSTGLEGPTDATQSPTMSRPLTKAGTIVGTFQYMAPEQLEGGEADARTDIFALGAVLYEMATGQRAFSGTSQASLIASILKEQPRAMADLAPMTPPALEHLVKRCLAKDPDDRWQSARDVGLELAWIRDAGSSAGISAPVAAHRRRAARTAWIAAAVCAAAAIGFGSLLLTHRSAPPMPIRFTVEPPANYGFVIGQPHVAVSPDGSALAYCATDTVGVAHVFVRRLDSHESIRINGTQGASMPFFSPDGAHLAYFSAGKLRRVSIADGVAQALCDAPDPRGGTWSRNDDIVFQPAASGPIVRVSARGGETRVVTEVDTANGDATHRFPMFLPDGKRFVFVVLPPRDQLFDVRVGSLDGETSPVIARMAGAPVYSRSGYLLSFRDEHIIAAAFDARSLEVEGEPVPIGEMAGVGGGYSGAGGATVSENDVLVRTFAGTPNTTVQWLGRDGRPRGRITVPSGFFVEPVFSPDGRRMTLVEWRPDGAANIWMFDVERDVATRFTFENSENFDAMWSPDGKSIVFTSNREGRENLYIKPSDGSREEEKLFDSGELFTKTEAWAPDGSGIVFSVLTEKTNSDLWLFPMTGDRVPRPLLQTRFNEGDAAISPDGRWIAYRSDDAGRAEIYVRSFPDMGPKHRASSEERGVHGVFQAFYAIHWVAGGRELVYLAGDGSTLLSVGVSGGATLTLAPPRPLCRLPLGHAAYAAHPDGQRLIVCGPDVTGTPFGVTVVMNWPALLGRR